MCVYIYSENMYIEETLYFKELTRYSKMFSLLNLHSLGLIKCDQFQLYLYFKYSLLLCFQEHCFY